MQRHVAVSPANVTVESLCERGNGMGVSAPFEAQPCIVCIPLAVPTRAFFLCPVPLLQSSWFRATPEQQAAFALVLSGILLFLFSFLLFLLSGFFFPFSKFVLSQHS